MNIFFNPALKFSVETHPMSVPGVFLSTFELINKSKKSIEIKSIGWESKTDGHYTSFFEGSRSEQNMLWPFILQGGGKHQLKIPQQEISERLGEMKNFALQTSDGKIYRQKLTKKIEDSLKCKPHFCHMPKNQGQPPQAGLT